MSENPEDMKTSELLAEVRQSILDDRDFPYPKEILKRLVSGRMTQTQFDRAQREGFEQMLPQMMEAWTKGYLFGCQGLDFLSCMMLTREQVDQDRRTYDAVISYAQALGRDQEPMFNEIKAFGTVRVMIPYETRRMFLNDKGLLKKSSEMTPGQIKTYQTLRERFISEAFKWSWSQQAQGQACGQSDKLEDAQ